ncbi:helix-turn-helix transcriptional regulator [Ahniella affigens]|nr:WYL domain-containing protein [Ahniella affigens]
MTAPELARLLEVSERTILRDIDQLSAAGVPVYAERGRDGGFCLRRNWRTDLNGLTEAESRALIFAGLPGPAMDLGLGAQALSARLKMLSALPTPWREQSAQVSERFHIDPIDWYRQSEQPKALGAIAQAVWDGHGLTMRYQSWNGPRDYDLAPLGLVIKAGTWYLVAASERSGHLGTYRLAKVLSLQVTKRAVKRPRDFDLSAFWQQTCQRFEASLRQIDVDLEVTARGLEWLQNLRMPHQVLSVAGSAAGWQRLHVAIESLAHGARQLLSLGAEVRVLKPEALRRELAALAEQCLQAHAPRSTPLRQKRQQSAR